MASNKSILQQYVKVFKLVYELSPATLLFSFLYALSSVLLPYLNLLFLGQLINQVSQGRPLDELVKLIVVFVSLVLVFSLLNRYFVKKRDEAENDLTQQLRAQLTQRLLRIDYAALDDPEMRKNYQRAKEGANYNGGLYAFVMFFLFQFFQMVVAIVVSSAALVTLVVAKTTGETQLAQWTNSPWFALLVLGLIVFPLVSALILAKIESKVQLQMLEDTVEINRWFGYFTMLLQKMENGKIFRLYQAEDFFLTRVKARNQKTFAIFDNVFRKLYRYSGAANFVIGLTLTLIYFLISLKAFVGAVAIGSVLSYVGYFQQLIDSLNGFLLNLGQNHTIVSYLEYYYDFLYGEDMMVTDGTLPVEKRDDNEFEIEFIDVSFKYPRSEEYVLKNFSLKLNIGERLAIVGQNGSGKTTFIKLLCRLYQPTSGVITLNGIDIQKYARNEYQSLLAVVFQDFKLFSFSVAENVSASMTPDYQRVEEALEIAGVAERVKEMPKGMDTTLTTYLAKDGVEVSGGEGQKIGIARAWYKDAPFVILDEPTSALDPHSEYEIYKRFDDLIAAKTALYISHRMSSTRFSQRIIVFDEGRVCQTGTHESLMATPGLYQKLFNAQAQYYVTPN